MTKERALELLSIADSSSGDKLTNNARKRFRGLHAWWLEPRDLGGVEVVVKSLKEIIEAYKLLNENQESQATDLSSIIISLIRHGHRHLIKLMLKAAPNDENEDYLNLQSTSGEIPLIYLFKQKHVGDEEAAILLEGGASPNIRNKDGQTPLHMLYQNKHALSFYGKGDKITELLLDKGARLDIQDNKGQTPLHIFLYNSAELISYYKDNGHERILELLSASSKQSINIQDSEGQTPLHKLCQSKLSYDEYSSNYQYNAAKLLIKSGADPDLKDKYGKKPAGYTQFGSKIGRLLEAASYSSALLYSCGAFVTAYAAYCLYLSPGILAVCVALTLYCIYSAICATFLKPSPELKAVRAECLGNQHNISDGGSLANTSLN